MKIKPFICFETEYIKNMEIVFEKINVFDLSIFFTLRGKSIERSSSQQSTDLLPKCLQQLFIGQEQDPETQTGLPQDDKILIT